MKKNILFYSEKWETGGVEALLVNIIDKINKDKFNINILTSQKETDMYDEMLKTKNCKIIQTLNKKYKNPIKRTIKNLSVFKKKLKECDVDIFHVNIYNSVGLIYAWIAKNIGIKKIIVHAHNTGIDNDKFKIKFLAHYLCKIIFKSKKFTYITCSQEASDFCFGNKDAILFRNGIETYKYIYNEDIRLTYRKKFNLENKLIIGNVARFVKQKNHEFLIEIFKEVLKLNENAVLVLVGQGPLKQKIIQKVKESNLEQNVIFLEKRTDINNLMQMMDVFCLPSLYEGLGIVLIEAQTSGLPCIISNRIPDESIISDAVRIVNLDDNIEKWAKNIIISNNISERGDKSKNTIENGYDITQNVKFLEDIYLEENSLKSINKFENKTETSVR